jgi:hypothetical protein
MFQVYTEGDAGRIGRESGEAGRGTRSPCAWREDESLTGLSEGRREDHGDWEVSLGWYPLLVVVRLRLAQIIQSESRCRQRFRKVSLFSKAAYPEQER